MTKVFRVLALSGIVSTATASFTTNLKIKKCDQHGCKPVQKRVALDATSAGTEKLITVSGDEQDALTLSYGGADVGGPRVYLIEEEGVNKNTMFALKSQELWSERNTTSMCGPHHRAYAHVAIV